MHSRSRTRMRLWSLRGKCTKKVFDTCLSISPARTVRPCLGPFYFPIAPLPHNAQIKSWSVLGTRTSLRSRPMSRRLISKSSRANCLLCYRSHRSWGPGDSWVVQGVCRDCRWLVSSNAC
jgi:hypothetical protein